MSKKVYTELSTHNYERNGNERTKFNSRIEKRICNWSADYRGYFLPVTVSDDHVLKCTERFFPTVFLLEQFNAILCLFLILFLYKKKKYSTIESRQFEYFHYFYSYIHSLFATKNKTHFDSNL